MIPVVADADTQFGATTRGLPSQSLTAAALDDGWRQGAVRL